MSIYLVFILMIFAHIVDDYYLQGILASMKQKSWWEKQYTSLRDEEFYGKDYIVALIMHGLSWSIMISLPIFFFTNWNPYNIVYFMIIFNTILHAVTDNQKANAKSINLWQDQLIHLSQILITWGLIHATYESII